MTIYASRNQQPQDSSLPDHYGFHDSIQPADPAPMPPTEGVPEPLRHADRVVGHYPVPHAEHSPYQPWAEAAKHAVAVEAKRRGNKWIAIAAAGSIALGLASIHAGLDSDDEGPKNIHISTDNKSSVEKSLQNADPTTAALYASSLVQGALLDESRSGDELEETHFTKESIAQADRIIRATDHIPASIHDGLAHMIDLREGQLYLRETGKEAGQDSGIDPAATLPPVSPELKKTLLQAYAGDEIAAQVDGQLEDTDKGDKRFEAARAAIDASPAGKAAKEVLNDYVDHENANAILQAHGDEELTPEQTLEQLKRLKNSKIEKAASLEVQADVAEDIQYQLDQKEITKSRARQIAEKLLSSGPLKNVMQRYLRKWVAPYDSSVYKEEGDLHEAIQAANAQAEELTDDVPDTQPEFTDKLEEKLDDEYDQTVAKVEERSAQLVAKEIAKPKAGQISKEFKPYKGDPREVIDLTSVKGRIVVPNAIEMNTATKLEDIKPIMEFATVTVQKGELVLEFHDGGTLPPRAKEIIQAQFEVNRAMLASAFRTGELRIVRIAVSDEFNPYVENNTREQLMLLPADNSTSAEQFGASWTHETAHALVRDAMYGHALTQKQAEMIVETCAAVKTTVYDRLESTATLYEEQVSAIEAKMDTKHKIIFQDFAKAAKAGELDKDLIVAWKASPYSSVYNNECAMADGVLVDSLYHYARKHGINTDDLAYMFKMKELNDFAQSVYRSVLMGNIYRQLNESKFIRTDYDLKELGHSQENVKELQATVMDGVLSYGPRFGETLRDMPDNEKAATLKAVDMSSTILMAQHPELKPIVLPAVLQFRKAMLAKN